VDFEMEMDVVVDDVPAEGAEEGGQRMKGEG
jgi:hypothetical protein